MRIAVGMSGGVDSSLAALLLRDEGHEVIGVTAWLWRCDSPTPAENACCGSVEAILRARDAARALGLEHRVVNLSGEFEECVVAQTVRAYASGLTPNPCAVCNARVRFPLLAKAARELGAEALATGHYARLAPRDAARDGGGVRLLRGKDPEHDQSYFLFAVSPGDLAFARFPLGDLTKAEVRERMAHEGHPAAATPSSQDLCFAGAGSHGSNARPAGAGSHGSNARPAGAGDVASLVRSRAPEAFLPGDIVHVDGRTVGRHEGLARYTVGQRRGIGVAWSEPLYVVEIRPATNTLVVGPDEALLRDAFTVGDVTWLVPAAPRRDGGALDCLVQIRYRMKAVPGRVTLAEKGGALRQAQDAAVVSSSNGGGACVELARPVRAVAPGQAAVFYAETPEGEEVMGGGWIGR
jgi:tRNA-specific 2-thiouridylase